MLNKYSSLEELEFSILKEVKIELLGFTDKDKEFISLFNKLFYPSWKDCFVIFCGKLDNLSVFYDENQRILVYDGDTSQYKIGDLIFLGDDKIVDITEIINKSNYLIGVEEIIREKELNCIDTEDISKIDIEFIEKKIKEQIKENKKKEAEKVAEEMESEKLKSDIKEKFEKESIALFLDSKMEVNGKSIKRDENEFILKDKNISKIFTYDDLNYLVYWNFISKIRERLINLKVDFTFKINNSQDEININFKDGSVIINNQKINKTRLNAIFNFYESKKQLSKEDLTLLNKLSTMKFEFLDNKSICLNTDEKNLSIPLEISLVDDDNFKLTLMNKERVFNWEEVKRFFFCNGSIRCCSTNLNRRDFIEFTKLFNIGKGEVLDNLRKLKLLDGLKNENN